MPDNTKDPGPEDGKQININQDHEVEYWTKKLGCTKAQLVDCVKKVGPIVADVKRCLGK
jgi:hypothetical protein